MNKFENKHSDDKNIAIMVNLFLDDDYKQSYDINQNNKKLILVPMMKFGSKLLSAKNPKEFTIKVLFLIEKEKETLTEINKLMTLHNIPFRNLLIKFSIHLKDKKTNEIYHYEIKEHINSFLNITDDIFNDIQKYVEYTENTADFLTITETEKLFKKHKDFIEVVEVA